MNAEIQNETVRPTGGGVRTRSTEWEKGEAVRNLRKMGGQQNRCSIGYGNEAGGAASVVAQTGKTANLNGRCVGCLNRVDAGLRSRDRACGVLREMPGSAGTEGSTRVAV